MPGRDSLDATAEYGLIQHVLQRAVGSGQLGVGSRPDALDAAAGADKKGGGSESNESHQQRILDQVLALLVIEKVCEKDLHVCHLKMSLCARVLEPQVPFG